MFSPKKAPVFLDNGLNKRFWSLDCARTTSASGAQDLRVLRRRHFAFPSLI